MTIGDLIKKLEVIAKLEDEIDDLRNADPDSDYYEYNDIKINEKLTLISIYKSEEID